EGLRRQFKVTIPANDVEKRVETELQEIGRSARLPGFRPGKIPMQVLKQRFGQSVRGRVAETAVNDSTHQLLNERGLRAAGQPHIEITSFNEGGDLEYDLAFDLMPEIKPIEFGAIQLERQAVEVSEKEVDEALERLAQAQKRSSPIAEPRPAKLGDVVVVDFEGRIDGVAFPGGKAEGHYLELGSKSTIPGFEDQIAGHSVGEDFDVEVTFPADYPKAELAGKAAKFATTIKEIREPQTVAVDEQLAKDMGAESLEKLRELMKGRIERDYNSLSRGKLKRALLDWLAQKHDFTAPAGLVDGEFDAIWQQIEADRQQGRKDPDDEGKSDEQLKKEYREIAERRVKLGLLLSEVGRLNNIEVGNDEISRQVAMEAQRYPGREKEVVEYYRRTPAALAQLRAPLYEEKVVDYILEQAQVTERKVTAEELTGATEAAEPAKS
ncbi:MAG: trigger factor, partial [Dongiaceae bacterium]